MNGTERNQQLIAAIAEQILSQGYRPFIAKRGDYGIFTDADGTRVVSFGSDLGGVNFSGNYKTSAPQLAGTGWPITDNISEPVDCAQIFNSAAPLWATGGAKWRYTTLAEHLKTYQPSSQYEEVTAQVAA